MAKISFVLEKEAVTVRKAMRALKCAVDKVLTSSARQVEIKLRRILKKVLMESPEFVSVSRGQLQAEFGLPDGGARMVQIIDTWVNSITVSISKALVVGGSIKASLKISAIERDWSDVLSLPAARLITEKGAVLPWLEWLLTSGTRIIIREYDVSMTTRARSSRTGRAIMVKGRTKRWRVPPEFSGTTRNNFVTRAVESVEKQVLEIMKQEIRKQAK